MPGTTVVAGQKRKAAGHTTGSNAVARKRQKSQDARHIVTQTADKALSKSGELNINNFIQSREFEINALNRSMQKARQSLTSRAFQQVPRHLRRRTASHNAKKVPRRLRRRAEREMKEDNTPTVTSKTRTPTSRLRLRLANARALKHLNRKRQNVRQKIKEVTSDAKETDPSKHISIIRVPKIKKNSLAKPPTATTKFKRRQINKTWLPTHLWHVKRARMTRPTEPLWRMAIPLTPTEKGYRPSHRAASSRGAIAWDVSYMSTMSCLGTTNALEGVLRSMGFQGAGWSGQKYRKWQTGTRFATSWVRKIVEPRNLIAPVSVVWAPDSPKVSDPDVPLNDTGSEVDGGNRKKKKVKLERRLFIRIHPSAFHEFWVELLKAAKLQKPQVLVEDLRFEIGSIAVTGPGSAEALQAVLQPVDEHDLMSKTWKRLGGLTNAASMPLNALMSFAISDPRLNHAPKQVKVDQPPDANMSLLDILTNWPLDSYTVVSPLFSHKLRRLASKLPSQKAINRRRAAAKDAKSGRNAAVLNDVPIPVMILAHRPDAAQTGSQGTWTILAPWRCIDPIWKPLMHYPLSSGSCPRFGGLQESQQIAFERCIPWFPADYPGCEAGKAWERTQAERRFDDWVRKPPSRRLAYHSIDLGLGRRGELGRGWTCDWDILLQSTVKLPEQGGEESSAALITQLPPTCSTPLTQRQRKAAKAKEERERRNTSSPESEADISKELPTAAYSHISGLDARSFLENLSTTSLPNEPVLITITVKLLTKGTPVATARIYRLPRTVHEIAETSEGINTASAKDLGNCDKDLPANSTPPAAQGSPQRSRSGDSQRLPQAQQNSSDLRARWLEQFDSVTRAKTNHIPKVKTNHHSLPVAHHVHPAPNLRNVIVLPPGAPQEVIDQHGPKPLSEAELQEEQEAALRIRLEEESVWDSHIPCPGEEDLIGFVTSGGYNLSEGRGTAIGSVWAQKVVEQWTEPFDTAKALPDEPGQTGSSLANRTRHDPSKRAAILQQRTRRERHLCIVRNAGESVGRLATWEVCD